MDKEYKEALDTLLIYRNILLLQTEDEEEQNKIVKTFAMARYALMRESRNPPKYEPLNLQLSSKNQ